MTTPKSPDEICQQLYLTQAGLSIEKIIESEKFLRSSMANLLCYMAERMQLPCDDEVFYDKDGNSFSNPRTLLIEEARKISEV